MIESGVRIGRGCTVGPFARLRRGTVLEDGASVGNFVEVKASRLGRGSKARHLAYLGDADLGHGVNVGAGTITCNYDGKRKSATSVGEPGANVKNTGAVNTAPVNTKLPVHISRPATSSGPGSASPSPGVGKGPHGPARPFASM